MKKFLLKISGSISAFFQKIFKGKKKIKKYSDNLQEVYGIPPSMLKEMEKDKKRQILYDPPQTDFFEEKNIQNLYPKR